MPKTQPAGAVRPEPIPVPRPWGKDPTRSRWGRRLLRGSGVALLALAALMLGFRALGLAAPGESPAQTWAPPITLAGLGLLALALSGRGRPQRELPELINAVAVSRAGERPGDNWVHLFRVRGAGAAGVVALVLLGLLALGGGAAGVLGFFGILVQPAGERTPLLGVVGAALVLVGAGLLWAAGLSRRASRRGASFGERPAGVSLGPHAILVHAAGIDREIPWGAVAGVSAQRLDAGSRAVSLLDAAERLTPDGVLRQPLDVIRIDLAAGEPQLLARATSACPPELLFNALLCYHATPGARAELGTTAGQRRLEAWAASLPAA